MSETTQAPAEQAKPATTAVQSLKTDTPPNSGTVKARAVIPECKVMKRLEDQGEDGILKTIENMTGDVDFAKKFIMYTKIQVRNSWRRAGDGSWYNLFDKVPVDSVLECLYGCARRKVLPDGYNAYLVVYLGKNPKCQLLVDYKGLCDMAIAEGICQDVGACEVRENDDIEIDFGEVTHFKIDPKHQRGNVIGCVAFAILPNGRRKTIFVDIDELEKIRACAQSDNIWQGWTAEMYKKSAIRRLFKTMQNTPRLRALMDADNEDYQLSQHEQAPRKRASVKSLAGSPAAALPPPETVEVGEPDAIPAEPEPVFA